MPRGRPITATIQVRPYGLTTWRVYRGTTLIGNVKKTKVGGQWKYTAYDLKNQMIGTAQFKLLAAKDLFKTRS